jgi:hypothetical protein
LPVERHRLPAEFQPHTTECKIGHNSAKHLSADLGRRDSTDRRTLAPARLSTSATYSPISRTDRRGQTAISTRMFPQQARGTRPSASDRTVRWVFISRPSEFPSRTRRRPLPGLNSRQESGNSSLPTICLPTPEVSLRAKLAGRIRGE